MKKDDSDDMVEQSDTKRPPLDKPLKKKGSKIQFPKRDRPDPHDTPINADTDKNALSF